MLKQSPGTSVVSLSRDDERLLMASLPDTVPEAVEERLAVARPVDYLAGGLVHASGGHARTGGVSDRRGGR